MRLYKEFFAKQLHAAIDRKGWTQAVFAEKMKVENSAVSNWLSGKFFPQDEKLPLICEVLEVDQRYFLPFTKGPEQTETQKAFKIAKQLAAVIDPNGLGLDDFLFIVEHLKNIPGELLVMLCKVNDPEIYHQIRGIILPLVNPEVDKESSNQ